MSVNTLPDMLLTASMVIVISSTDTTPLLYWLYASTTIIVVYINKKIVLTLLMIEADRAGMGRHCKKGYNVFPTVKEENKSVYLIFLLLMPPVAIVSKDHEVHLICQL